MWVNGVNENNLRNVDSRRHPHHGNAVLREPLHEPLHPTEDVEEPDVGDDEARGHGTWGEQDVGFCRDIAMADYQALRHNLAELGRTRSRESQLTRRTTDKSRRSTLTGRLSSRPSQASVRDQSTAATDKDVEAANPPDPDEKDSNRGDGDDEDFELGDFMREGHFEKRKDQGSAKKVGVLFKNLTVKGIGASASFVRTLPDAILGTFGPDLYHIVAQFIPAVAVKKGPMRTLINDFVGCVRDGEMLLVLGRPGSGCTTFLKAIANDRKSFAEVSGKVSYGGISADKQKKMYRGEVNYNQEDDIHFASLNVWQTFVFALTNKTKKKARADIPIIAEALMKMFGISHTKYTLVGDEYTRGVSGGERKRVSIAETLASKSTVICWDNSTRGLDASTALDYAKSLRIMTDVSDRTTLVTLYQAGEGIYDLMDKVMVIDAGRQIFMGRADEARQYFVDLGFDVVERQTTADFLTAVTDPVERRFRPGCEASTPKTAEELERAFRESPYFQKVLDDMTSYEEYLKASNYEDARDFEATVQEGKSKHVQRKSPYTVSFFRQVLACTKRELWLILGDTTTLYTKAFIIVSNGLIVGSLFYGESLDTSGAFSRGGALFFSILFLGWLQLTELMKAVSGRAVVARHREYAFYRPSAVSIARVVVDIPVVAIQVVVFAIIMYFMCGLDVEAGKFFIYALFVYINTILLTALYRMFASFSPEIDTAVRFSGLALNLLIVYTGYVIPKPQLIQDSIWFGWVYYINPISYSFEAVLANEFSGRVMDCAPSQLVPQGPNTDPAYQGCAIAGSGVNSRTVTGDAYIGTSFDYSTTHLWRNFGVVIAWTVLYILITALATELFSFAPGGGGAVVFKKTKKAKKVAANATKTADEEQTVGSPGDSDTSVKREESLGESPSSNEQEEDALQELAKSDSIFTWRDVEYTVPYLGGERKLLDMVNGYAKPGVMVALMGASGAGKTTLLNTLSQRQSIGVVKGEMLVDGRALNSEFQRSTGFCLQGDLHDETATIREALEFSAILRQPAKTPRAEKIAYVDSIIELLELNDLQDAIISSLGVEQRKRLTIGVELAAKPSLLLFLDEPTSGLDSQSAFSIVRFLKKLAQAGQAIVCTIHQPSSVLIQQFDMILTLNPGGKTFYFGPVGENGSAVIKYFADRGVECPPGKNVAEFILETAAKPTRRPDGTKIDWNEEWKRSPEAQAVIDEIEGLKLTRSRTAGAGHADEEQPREFAASVSLQCTELLKRTFKQYWRSPSYLYGKLFVAVIIGIFNGFTFWKLGNSTQDMQNRMFTAFLILTIPPTVVNAVVPKFFTNMSLWQAREYPSRIYGWFAFTTAQVVAEIPPAIISAVVYWALWYWPTGLPTESSVSGYVFLMVMLFFFFQASWGQWICAFAPSFTVISNVLPFFFVMFSLFNGVIRPYSYLPVFWRYFVYYLNPSSYWIGGVLAATLHGIPVQCTESETAHFDAPPGMSCQSYAGDFAQSAGGHLLNPQASSNCMYCPYKVGDQYLATLNIQADQKWRDFGIFLAFCVSNWFLVYFFIWSVRIKGWSFGFGYIFGGLGKLAKSIKKPLTRIFTKQRA